MKSQRRKIITETLINPNQIRDDGSSGLKVVNIIQSGNLNIQGPIIKGFSSSNYIQMSSKFSYGYWYFANNAFCPTELIKTANSWEMFCKVKVFQTSGSKILWNDNSSFVSYTTCMLTTSNQISAGIVLGNSSWGDLCQISTNIPNITENEKECYIKFGFTGDKYYVELSLNKDVWDGSHRAEKATTTKLTANVTQWKFGAPVGNAGAFNGSFDLTDWKFTLNDEVIWKGVETL